jgi:hypothetical protein
VKLPIEEWVDESALPEDVCVALREAVTCFKASGYRSALLFSYIAWNLAIRARVLSAQRPSLIPEDRWKQIADQLRDDDRWDAQAFDCTQMKSPAPIFPVSDDLRVQVRYWKDRRNDCAHFKLNQVSSSHVEAFWSFMQSNLGRFVPAGSEADLLQRLVRHFDPNYTAPGIEVSPLAAQVPLSVEKTRYPQFLAALVECFSYKLDKTTYIRTDELAQVFQALLGSSEALLVDAAVEVCAKEPLILVAILRRTPGLCLYWSKKPDLIRSLWRQLLFEEGHQDLPVFAGLLRNNLIPQDELAEANVWVSDRLRGDVPRPEDFPALSQAGFFDALKKFAFEDWQMNQFKWGNRNAAIVRWYVETFPLAETVATALCTVFSSPPYPFGVRDALQQLFSSDQKKLKEFQALAKSMGRTVPEDLLANGGAEA